MTPLYKEHSYAACISEGYKFLAEHLLLTLKVFSPIAAANALCMVLYFYFYTEIMFNAQSAMLNGGAAAGSTSMSTKLGFAVFFILYNILDIILIGRLFLFFRRIFGIETSEGEDNQQTAKNAAWKTTMVRTGQLTWRSIPYTIWPLLLGFGNTQLMIPAAQFLAGMDTAWQIFTGCAMLLLSIAAVVAAVPLCYTFCTRMMQPLICKDKETAMQYSFAVAYRKGFRHRGKIFGVMLLAIFIVMLASVVLMLPGIISILAYAYSTFSTLLMGDTTIIPTGAGIGMIAVNTLCFFCINILSIAAAVTALYLHGDIFSKDREQQTADDSEEDARLIESRS